MSDLKAAYSKYVTNAGIATMAEAGEIEYCTINSVTRTITIPDSMKIAGVEFDNDTKSIYFKMDKVVQGVDMSTYNIFVNYTNASGEPDRYSVTDKQVDGDSITFSWEISDFATAARGTINFVVCLEDSTGKHWNTTLAQLTVLPGLETSKDVSEQLEPDAISQIYSRLIALENSGGNEPYELIKEITLDAPARGVDITTDSDGAPLQLKDFLVQIDGVHTGESGIELGFVSVNTTSFPNMYQVQYADKDISSGFYKSIVWNSGAVVLGSYGTGAYAAKGNTNVSASVLYLIETINSISVMLAGAHKTFKEGAKFTLYGRRA